MKKRALEADIGLVNATIITMDQRRSVIRNGAIALKDDRIVWVGQSKNFGQHVIARKTIDYANGVISPGFVNGHVHVTGDPLTRHYMPDDLNTPDKMEKWVLPRYFSHSADDENVSSCAASVELLKSGTTTFIEAGTIRHLDAAAEGISRTGIRARIGGWVEGRNYADDDDQTNTFIDQAISTLEEQNRNYPNHRDALVSAWPILVGHNTNPGEVWQAAKSIADDNQVILAAHMSPYAADPEWFLQHEGCRPLEYLDKIEALGPNVVITHATHLDQAEVQIMSETGANVAFCPFASLKGAFSVSGEGRYLQLIEAGVKFSLATDGYDCEILPVARLAGALFKDLANDVGHSSALRVLEMITIEAAGVMGLDDEIGSIEVGKKADLVCFDCNNFQWRPLLSPIDQLIWSADARSIKDVWVNGLRVIQDGISTQVDEVELFQSVQETAERVIQKSELPYERTWETV